MKRLAMNGLLAAIVVTSLAVLAQPKSAEPAAGDLPPAEAAREGATLVADLLSRPPDRNTTNSGTLRIREAQGKITRIPVRFEIASTPTNWFSRYEARVGEGGDGVVLTVVHKAGAPNDYLLETTQSGQTSATPRKLTGEEANIPFAGSDFWLTDLGLEFLHWPKQSVVRKQMRRSVFCHVLVSENPQPPKGGYSKVISWIDIDSGGIVHADAYGAKGERLKQFVPKEITKVKGEYQLEEMEIRNLQSGSRTTIEFDLK